MNMVATQLSITEDEIQRVLRLFEIPMNEIVAHKDPVGK